MSLRTTLALAALCVPASAQLKWTLTTLGVPAPAQSGYAYDTDRGLLLTFGGTKNATITSDIYEWDTNSSWNQISPASGPAARNRPAVAYDQARREFILMGGVDRGGSQFSDAWKWDGRAWSRLPAGPSARSGSAMCYDSDRGVVVLFGGWNPSRTDHRDTWEWDGSAWKQVRTANSPPGRGAHRMVYDPVNKVCLVQGGFNTPSNGTVSDTWIYDGTDWKDATGAVTPGSLCDMILDWDAARERVVLYGGLTVIQGNGSPNNRTYDWNGSVWERRTIVGPSPPARAFSYHAYTDGRLAIAGGSGFVQAQGETWDMEAVNPASCTEIGAGCAGSAGTPKLECSQLPWLNSTFDITVSGAPASESTAFVIFGISNSTWGGVNLPYKMDPIGGNGCILWSSIDLTVAVPLTNGSGTTQGVVCNCPNVLGASFYLQALVPDANAPRPAKAAMSNAIEGVIGER